MNLKKLSKKFVQLSNIGTVLCPHYSYSFVCKNPTLSTLILRSDPFTGTSDTLDFRDFNLFLEWISL